MKVKEICNLTTDPNYGEKGDVKYCNFNVAINNPYDKDDTEFVKISTFGKQAEACRDHLKKGSQICIEGTVNTAAYLSNDGEARASLNIKASDVMFLGRSFSREQNIEHNHDGYSQIDDALRKNEEYRSYRNENQGSSMER